MLKLRFIKVEVLYTAHTCSRMQPKSQFWPVPFNMFPLIVEWFEPKRGYVPLRDPINTEVLRILCDVVVGYLKENHGLDFESSNGRTLGNIQISF